MVYFDLLFLGLFNKIDYFVAKLFDD